jgi:hypothetical protein
MDSGLTAGAIQEGLPFFHHVNHLDGDDITCGFHNVQIIIIFVSMTRNPGESASENLNIYPLFCIIKISYPLTGS